MANDLHPGKKIYPAHRDPIRIVPLHLPDSVPQPTAEAAAAGPAPQGMRSHLNIHYLFFGLQHSSCNCAVSVQPLLQMPQSRGHAAALADSSSPPGVLASSSRCRCRRCHPHKCLVARSPVVPSSRHEDPQRSSHRFLLIPGLWRVRRMAGYFTCTCPLLTNTQM
jgi:hypothetical protein